MSFKSRIDLMINTSSARLLSDQSHLSMVMIKISISFGLGSSSVFDEYVPPFKQVSNTTIANNTYGQK